MASEKSRIPVINAGDGGHQHPTQTLADLLTIRSIKGRLNNITIGFCGDLKFGRTVHSLINALIRYDNVRIVLISPEELKVPDYVRDDVLRANNIEFKEVEKLEDAMGELDVLYMTRVQKERFFNDSDEQLMFVVGATQGKLFEDVRRIAPHNFLLVPGVGAQGGSLEEVARYGMNRECGLLVNSSRKIIYAATDEKFAEAAREEALKVQYEMEHLLHAKGLL